eukprot:5417330-Pyramimonas_sp.AAC.1
MAINAARFRLLSNCNDGERFLFKYGFRLRRTARSLNYPREALTAAKAKRGSKSREKTLPGASKKQHMQPGLG